MVINNKHIKTIIVLSLLLLVGCAEKKKKYYRVISYTPRLSTFGFSIQPPPGKGWYEKLKDNSLIYLKKTDSNRYSIQTKATEINLSKSIQRKDKFIKYVHATKTRTLMSAKHKNAKFTYLLEEKKRTFCVKYKYRYEDHNYKNLKKNEYVVINNNGIVCMHPDKPANGIELSYKEKKLSSTKHRSYINEGEKFLNTLAFVSPTN